MGVAAYLLEFVRAPWIKGFFAAKTAPLVSPPGFRDFPHLTGNACTHCLACRMICPAPGAIEVELQADGRWEPRIMQGHCFRCGCCVEVCPEQVLASGDLLRIRNAQGLSYVHAYIVQVNPLLCMGCGNCCTSCPVNRETDPDMGAGGTSSSDDVLMRVENGKTLVLHNALCKGCKICQDTCPNGAMHVVRTVEAVQLPGGSS
jgi:energy-converting hydrogenase A subunit P